MVDEVENDARVRSQVALNLCEPELCVPVPLVLKQQNVDLIEPPENRASENYQAIVPCFPRGTKRGHQVHLLVLDTGTPVPLLNVVNKIGMTDIVVRPRFHQELGLDRPVAWLEWSVDETFETKQVLDVAALAPGAKTGNQDGTLWFGFRH
jgi:hypothetical protein